MIVELFGCPGSGKSFLTDRIVEQEYAVREPGGTNQIKVAAKRAAKKAMVYFPSSLALKRRIYREIKGLPKTPVFIERPLRVWIDNLVMLNFVYGVARNKKLCMDEGLVQRTISMCINFQWNTSIAIKIIDMLPGRYISTAFFMDMPVNDCLKSIKFRDRHAVEMDEMDDDQLFQYIECFYDYCTMIAETIGCKRVTRDDFAEIEGLFR